MAFPHCLLCGLVDIYCIFIITLATEVWLQVIEIIFRDFSCCFEQVHKHMCRVHVWVLWVFLRKRVLVLYRTKPVNSRQLFVLAFSQLTISSTAQKYSLPPPITHTHTNCDCMCLHCIQYTCQKPIPKS